jgi:hypothetical protein
MPLHVQVSGSYKGAAGALRKAKERSGKAKRHAHDQETRQYFSQGASPVPPLGGEYHHVGDIKSPPVADDHVREQWDRWRDSSHAPWRPTGGGEEDAKGKSVGKGTAIPHPISHVSLHELGEEIDADEGGIDDPARLNERYGLKKLGRAGEAHVRRLAHARCKHAIPKYHENRAYYGERFDDIKHKVDRDKLYNTDSEAHTEVSPHSGGRSGSAEEPPQPAVEVHPSDKSVETSEFRPSEYAWHGREPDYRKWDYEEERWVPDYEPPEMELPARHASLRSDSEQTFLSPHSSSGGPSFSHDSFSHQKHGSVVSTRGAHDAEHSPGGGGAHSYHVAGVRNTLSPRGSATRHDRHLERTKELQRRQNSYSGQVNKKAEHQKYLKHHLQKRIVEANERLHEEAKEDTEAALRESELKHHYSVHHQVESPHGSPLKNRRAEREAWAAQREEELASKRLEHEESQLENSIHKRGVRSTMGLAPSRRDSGGGGKIVWDPNSTGVHDLSFTRKMKTQSPRREREREREWDEYEKVLDAKGLQAARRARIQQRERKRQADAEAEAAEAAAWRRQQHADDDSSSVEVAAADGQRQPGVAEVVGAAEEEEEEEEPSAQPEQRPMTADDEKSESKAWIEAEEDDRARELSIISGAEEEGRRGVRTPQTEPRSVMEQQQDAALPMLVVPAKKERDALFNSLDVNGNGGVSLAEIDKGVVAGLFSRALVVQNGGGGSSGDAESFDHKPALMRAYHAADKSGDGFIERSEFPRLLQYMVFFNNFWHKFEGIDSDHDRRLDLAQFTAGCSVIGLALSPEQAELEFAGCDADGGE